jgi:polyisoprenyl-phosphate glycosyltransferase
MPQVSVITPLFNEEVAIPALGQRLASVFRSMSDISWEWVAVDDGSSDKTLDVIQKEIVVAPQWQIISLSKNFGQQAAYKAGLDAAQGEAVIFLDADMQDPPEKIPALVEAWAAGCDVVVGRRARRPERGIRGFLLRGFHRVFDWLTEGAMPRDSGTFGLCSARAARALREMPEVNLFLPAQRSWLGFKQGEIWYDRAARADEPKQSMRKLFAYAWNGIASFSEIPLHFISMAGVTLCLVGFAYAAFLIGIKILQVFGLFAALEVAGFTTLAVAVLCLGGIQLLCLGIIGEYLAKMYREIKRRPVYLIGHHRTNPPTNASQ